MTETVTGSNPRAESGGAGGGGGGARALARTGSLNFIGLVYYGAVNMLIVVIVSRGLGSARAGELFTSIAVFNVLLRALVFGSDIGLVRFVSRWLALDRASELRRLWAPALLPSLLASCAAAAAVGFGAESLARAFGSDDHQAAIASQLRVLAAILPIGVVYFSLESASRGFGTMKPSVAIEKVGKVTLQIVLVTWAVVVDAGPRQLAAAWGMPIVVAFVAMAGWLIARQRRIGTRVIDPAGTDTLTPVPRRQHLVREFWRFCGPRAPAGVFQSALLWSDAIFIGAFASTREAGVYTAATRFLVISSLMQLAVGQSLQPLISAALARGNRDEAQAVFRSATAWTVLLTWPLLLGIMFFAPALLQIFPDDYGRAATSLAILAGAWMFAVGCGPVDNVLLMAGKSWFTTFNVGVAFVVNVTLNSLLIPAHGMIGAAIAWGLSLVINNLLPLFQVRRSVGISPFGPLMAQAMLPIGAFAASLAGARLLLGADVLGAVVGSVVGLGAYVGIAAARREALHLDDLWHGVRNFRRRG